MKKEKDDEKSRSMSLITYFLFFIFCLSVLYINRAQSYYYYERISFKSAGSTLYTNLYYPSKNINFQDKHPLVIYAHGIGSQRDIDLRITIELTKRGFFVAALDYHGQGESGGEITDIDPDTNVPALAQDCSKLLDALEKMSVYKENIDKGQIGLIGHSLGGMVVLQNQALDDRFKATVAWAPLVSFNPKKLRITEDERFEDYIPENLLNENNSKDLLVIHHVDDELLDFEDNAELAHKLTGCKLIKITESFGSPHQLISNKVLIKTINWFEEIFFDSETKNGHINLSYVINYILLGISLIALFSTVFYFMNYVSRYFDLKKDAEKESSLKILKKSSKKEVMVQCIKFTFYFSAFISIWLFFTLLYGLIGLFYASIVMLLSYLFIKLSIFLVKEKREKEKFNLIDFIKSQYDEDAIVYTILCTGIFLGLYIAFSIIYPFVFVFPSHPLSILLALSVYPLYIVFEIFYRKILYPKLYFIHSRKSKTIVITVLAIINHAILISLNISLAFLPAVLVFYLIFLLVIIKNSLIYEKTGKFITMIISSFIIIAIFFGAALSQALGIYSVLHLLI